METFCVFLVTNIIVTLDSTAPVYIQNIQNIYYRLLPTKCDRNGRCTLNEEVDQGDGHKSDKDRPPEVNRDDWKILDGKVDDSKPSEKRPVDGAGCVGGDSLKPAVDEEKLSDGRPGSDDNLKHSLGRDDVIKACGRPSGEGAYIQKPVVNNADIEPSVSRPAGGGSGYRSKGQILKSPVDRDDDLKLLVNIPGTGEGGYRSKGFKPKLAVDRDDDDLKAPVNRPVISGGGGYKPKTVADRNHDDLKPLISRPGDSGGAGYKPKPAVDSDDDLKLTVIRTAVRGGGYMSKPAVGRDHDDIKLDVSRSSNGGGDYEESYNPIPGRNRGGGGYNPKTEDDEYNIQTVRVVGGTTRYMDDDRKSNEDNLGDYNEPEPGTTREPKHDERNEKTALVVDRNCLCVPYYQCKNGQVVTDGVGIIDSRSKRDLKYNLPLKTKFQPQSCGPYHVCCNTSERPTMAPHQHRCGNRNPKGINSRIVAPNDAGETKFGEWPWQAAVLTYNEVKVFRCGGVLIDEYHVLTTAKCVYNLNQTTPLIVRLGEWDTRTSTEFLAHEDNKVSEVIIHPEFRNTSHWNDIAVLKLQDPVLFKAHIDTVCLPEYDEVFSGQNCVVTGWGKKTYKGGTFSSVMKEVIVLMIDNDKCQEMLRKTRLGRYFQLHESFLCAGGEDGIDACKGDGGGPLVCYRYFKGKTYALAGIVSWGVDCGQPEVPGVYVNISRYLDWISNTTGVSLENYWPLQ